MPSREKIGGVDQALQAAPQECGEKRQAKLAVERVVRERSNCFRKKYERIIFAVIGVVIIRCRF
jgi:hypothetical protein